MRRRFCVFFGLMMAISALTAGCESNQHSQRRLQIRRDNFQTTADGIEKRESRCPQYLRETGEAIEKRHAADERESKQNIEEAGDYIW